MGVLCRAVLKQVCAGKVRQQYQAVRETEQNMAGIGFFLLKIEVIFLPAESFA